MTDDNTTATGKLADTAAAGAEEENEIANEVAEGAKKTDSAVAGKMVGDTKDATESAVGGAVEETKQLAGGSKDEVKAAAGDTVKVAGKDVGEVVGGLVEAGKDTDEAVKASVGAAAVEAADSAKGAAETVASELNEGNAEISAGGSLFEGFLGTASHFVSEVVGAAEELAGEASGALGLGGITKAASEAIENVEERAKEIVDSVKESEQVKEFVDSVRNNETVKGIVESVRGVEKNIEDAMKETQAEEDIANAVKNVKV
jgi:hypothetical protein